MRVTIKIPELFNEKYFSSYTTSFFEAISVDEVLKCRGKDLDYSPIWILYLNNFCYLMKVEMIISIFMIKYYFRSCVSLLISRPTW